MAVTKNDLVVGPLVPANGVTTISLDFHFEQASWLEVYKSGSDTPLVLDTDYTVTGAGSSSGAVTLTVAANGTDAYSVYLAVPLQRSSDMQLRGEFKSEPFNTEMDRIWQALQRQNTLISRTARLRMTAAYPAPLLPASAETGKALVWGADGNLINAALDTGDIAVDVAAAEAARLGAETAQDAAETAQGLAETAQGLAEAAEDGAVAAAASIGIYADTTLAAALVTALTAASEGETFHATGDDVDYIGVYKDLSGVAVEQATYPKSSTLDNYATVTALNARWNILADKTSDNDVFQVSASVDGTDLIVEILDTIYMQTPTGVEQISAAGPFTMGGGQCLKIDLTGSSPYTVTQSAITNAIMAEQGRGETLILLQRLTARVAGPLAPMVTRALDFAKIDYARTKADRFASPVQGNALAIAHDHAKAPDWSFGRRTLRVTGLDSPYWYVVQPPFAKGCTIAVNEGTHTADLSHLVDGTEVVITSRYGCNIYAGDGVTYINSPANNLANLPADGMVRVTKIDDFNGAKVALEALAGTPVYSSTTRPTMGASILLAGQSQWELGATAGGIGGFEDELVTASSLWNGNYVTKDGTARYYINGATSGSAADMRSNGSNYWWNATGGTPGPALTACIADITAATGAGQPAPDTIMWRQGEADMAAIDGGTITQAQYVATLGAIFDYIIANGAGASPKFIVTPPGANDLALYFNGAMGVQAGYLDLIAARSDVFLGPAMFDLPRPFEDVHLTDLGYYTLGVRDAVAYAKHVNSESLSLGPEISSATLAGDGLSVDLAISGSGQMHVPPGSAGGYVDAGPYPFGFCAINGDPSTQDPIPLTHGEVVGYTGFQSSITVTLYSDTDLTGARIYTLPGQAPGSLERRYITDKRQHGCAFGFPMPFQRTAALS